MSNGLSKDFNIKIILTVFVMSLQLTLVAQKIEYSTTKITTNSPLIDGYNNDAAWDSIEWTGDFIQTRPFENTAPSQQTAFKVLYDDDNLYFLVRAFDSSPDSIVRRMSRRDGYEGDLIEVAIDSYHDWLTAFSFAVNASGVKSDKKVTNDDDSDESWDPIWYVKTSIDNQGWIAEIRIPLSQLRFGKKDQHVWGLQVTRNLFRKNERSAWQFISPQASGWVNHFGELHGIANIKPKKQKDITPYVVGRIENYEKDEDNPFADGRDYFGSIGLDGKIGITNDLTLDFTINPDFGQVEADPSEVNLTTFETFFPERRAFFIEGKEIISHRITQGGGPLSRDNLFYSRRVGRRPSVWPETDDDYDEYVKMPENTTILGAFKLTGKTQKGLSIGVIESFTQLEHAEIARKISNGNGEKEYNYRKEAAEPYTNYFATRIEQDFNEGNTRIGGMLTSTNRNLYSPELRDNLHSNAYTGGINFNHQWKDKTYYVNLNFVASQVRGTQTSILNSQTEAPHFFQRPDGKHLSIDSSATNLNGTGATFQIGKAGNGKWRFTNWITMRSPGLNLNDMGYMRRNDEIQQVFWIQYYENTPKSFYRSYRINFNQWYGSTVGFETRYYGFNMNGHLQFKNHWSTGFGFSGEGRGLSTEALRGGPSLINDETSDFFGYVETDERKKISLEIVGWGGYRKGKTSKFYGTSLDIDIQVSDAFAISMEPEISYSYDEIAFVSNTDFNDVDKFIRGTKNQVETSMEFRFSYNITPDFTIQYYAMPFISVGNYQDFKHITNPKATNFNDRFTAYAPNQIRFNEADDRWEINEEGFTSENTTDSDLENYHFDNPDFKVLDFNSNLVLRWEYLPGSTVYVVWTQQRHEKTSDGVYAFNDNVSDLFLRTYPHDVFLIKYSYRFGM